jgi:hypothetical protein
MSIRNPIRDGFAVLTPDVFRAIDILARRHAGRPFRIMAPSEMEGDWGRMQVMADNVYADLRRLSNHGSRSLFREIGIFEIANQINVAEFHAASRPEIDLSLVPKERIYEFVAWHEIGHVVDNFSWLDSIRNEAWMALADTNTHDNARHKLNEILADRYAWSRMFPERSLPIRQGCEGIAFWAEEWEGRLLELGIRRGRLNERRLGTTAVTFVPTSHVKRIPWSRLARPELQHPPEWLLAIREARRHDRNMRLRQFRKHAREMAALWTRIARNPTAKAMRLSREGRIASYMDRDATAAFLTHLRRSEARRQLRKATGAAT